MGGRIFISITIGIGLKTVGGCHQGTTRLVVAVGVSAGSRNSEVLHNDGAREGLAAARRGLVARGCNGEVISAGSGRSARNGVAGKRHARGLTSNCKVGIGSGDIDRCDGRAETDVLREVVGGELHGIVHRHSNASGGGTTVLILDTQRVSVVTSGRRGGDHRGGIGRTQCGARGPDIGHVTYGIGRGGRQRGGTAKTNGGRIGVGVHTQLGRDLHVHGGFLFVATFILDLHSDSDGLLGVRLCIGCTSCDALAHESGYTAFDGGSAEGVVRKVRYLVSTVEGCRGIGVWQGGNHRIVRHFHRHSVAGSCLATIVVGHGHRHGVVLSARAGRAGNLHRGCLAQLVGRRDGR